VRLGVGLRRYLNYPHAAAVVAASQVIAVLAVTITLSLLSPLLAFLLRLFWYP
jgi:hypothetical protein